MAYTGITIEASTSSDAWSRAVNDMIARLEAVTGDASVAAARAIQTDTRALLSERGHSELTFSNSPPGSPPAMVSGDLAESVTVVRSGAYSAMVGPTTKYGRIQELGGGMHGHPYMRYKKFSSKYGRVISFKETYTVLPARPYLEPATKALVDSGRVRDIYADFWSAAIEG